VANQVEVWPFAPSWSDSVDEIHEFRTEIITSRSGYEQRRALRATARRSWEFSSLVQGERFSEFTRAMNARHERSWVFGHPSDFVTLTTGLIAPSRALNVTNDPVWLTPGALAILAHGNNAEAVEIATVSGTAVTLVDAPFASWPVGTKLHPAMRARLPASVQTKVLTNRAAQIQVRLDGEPLANTAVAPGSAPQSFYGRELFTKRPNWAETPQITFDAFRESVDYGFGAVTYETPRTFRTRTIRATFLARDRAEALDVVRFFTRMAGQQGEFYMPSWTQDIMPSQALQVGTNTIRVVGTLAAADYGVNSTNKALVVYLADGSEIRRLVTGAVVSGNSTVISVDTPWPSTFPTTNIRYISWMPVWRFATDTLTIEWLTSTVAQFVLPMMTLQAFPAEATESPVVVQ
jgi:hypothetical protein